VSTNAKGFPDTLSWGSADKFLDIAEILFVSFGHVSPTFQNSQANPSMCFSIVTANRVLDLEAFDPQTADLWCVSRPFAFAEETCTFM
jgi:hypothetical protein